MKIIKAVEFSHDEELAIETVIGIWADVKNHCTTNDCDVCIFGSFCMYANKLEKDCIETLKAELKEVL